MGGGNARDGQGTVGQLDTKLGLLQQLIREADRAAARLEAALAAARAASPRPSAAESQPPSSPRLLAGEGPGVRTGGGETASEPRDRFESYSTGANQAEALKSATHGEPRVPAGGSGRVQPSESASEKQPREHRFQEIYTLADYGLNAAVIAQRVGAPVGEVGLILGRRGKP